MAEPRLTLADQALVNAAGCLVAPTVFDLANQRLALDCAAEVLGRANPDHRFMGPIITPMRVLVSTRAYHRDMANRAAVARDLMQLGDALGAFFLWRLGEALDAHRAGPKGAPS